MATGTGVAQEWVTDVFNRADTDKTGQLTARQLQCALSEFLFYKKFSEQGCRALLAMFDRQWNGTIDREEFKQVCDYVAIWKSVFQSFDKDRSGTVDYTDEFANALKQLGYRLSPQTEHLIAKKYIVLYGGRMTLDFFIEMCLSLHYLTHEFRKRDPEGTGTITIDYETYIQLGAYY